MMTHAEHAANVAVATAARARFAERLPRIVSEKLGTPVTLSHFEMNPRTRCETPVFIVAAEFVAAARALGLTVTAA